MDLVKATDVWNDKKKEFVKSGMSEEDIEFEKKDWFLLDAKRITLPNSFDFVVESVGVFSNFSIIYKACDIMIYKCKKFIDMIEKGDVSIEVSENTTISNEYTITLKNEDYTLGNVIVYFLYEKYYSGDKSLSFVGFRVPHPHIPNGVIRLAFEAASDTATVSQYLTFAAESVITTFTNIQKKFKE
jgi:DNA-directed RNA polymerase subunit L